VEFNHELNRIEKIVWQKFDANNDRELSLEEARPAVRFIISHLKGNFAYRDATYIKLFREFDENNSGTIDKAELKNLVRKIAGFDDKIKQALMTQDEKLDQEIKELEQ
jgi:Ca2+-binding EF-hand superfamily protein